VEHYSGNGAKADFMKNQKQTLPPRWAQRLLEWYCRPELLEDLQGDLNEYFERHCKTKGSRKAKLIYILDVFKFFRPYTIRKPEFLNFLIQWIMIGSYIKTSGRSIVRNKLFSFINIAGLAISMSVGLLMIGLLSDMVAYDTFHENRTRIYRVISLYKYLDKENSSYNASTSLRAGKSIEESVPGIEKTAILQIGFEGDIKFAEKTVPLSGFWANEAFFSVFTFPMVKGNSFTALKDPFSVVLTEQSAKKLFGDAEPLGKTIILPGKTDHGYVVTGVIRDIPRFSHMKFDMLASISTREITQKENKNEMSWSNMWSTYVYLLLPEQTDLKNLQANLNTLSAREDQTVKNTTIKLALQPMSEIALGEELNNSIGPVMGSSNVWMIGVLSFVVILSACFNYTNLSIARSIRRSREVGIRKVVGALKSHVMSQFIVESLMVALLALVFSFVLFVLLKPYFLSFDPQYQQMLALDLSPQMIVCFIVLAIIVGIMAGFFPALFFARVNAIRVLKNLSSVRVFKNITIRKALIVAQFTISLMFIAATIIGYKHYKQILAFDLGFNTENVLNIRLHGNKPELLTRELSVMPEVKEISQSALITSVGSYWGTTMKYTDPEDSTYVYFNAIDEHYLPLHGHKLLAGRNFSAQTENAVENEVIVNEKVLKRFSIGNGDPQKAIGEIVSVDRKKVQIVGVVKDYYYGRPTDAEMKEVIFRYAPAEAEYINIKTISADWPSTLAKIEAAWKKIDDIHPLDATFYDDQIEDAYSDYSARIKVIGSLAFLAICIASIGLLGMVVFTTETRLKEISIRKVMGAGEGSLIFLLSKGFLWLLGVSALIALPAAQFFFIRYAFDDYGDRAPIPLSELIMGVTSVMAIALLMIGFQTLKVARANPAEVLKNE
jgi:ABC-type antimicrobial peptide transport system permease subunit